MTKEKKLYLAGDMLSKPVQAFRAMERDALSKIDGYKVFNPADSPVNDKATMPLAERIFMTDTEALLEADTVVFDISGTIGTSMEVAQVWTMNYFVDKLQAIIEWADNDAEVADGVRDLLLSVPYKKVYWKSEDIRDHNEPEVGIRRSHSYNAYLIGCLLDLAGEPKTFENILGELEVKAKAETN